MSALAPPAPAPAPSPSRSQSRPRSPPRGAAFWSTTTTSPLLPTEGAEIAEEDEPRGRKSPTSLVRSLARSLSRSVSTSRTRAEGDAGNGGMKTWSESVIGGGSASGSREREGSRARAESKEPRGAVGFGSRSLSRARAAEDSRERGVEDPWGAAGFGSRSGSRGRAEGGEINVNGGERSTSRMGKALERVVELVK